MLYRIVGLAMTISASTNSAGANSSTGTIRSAYLVAFWQPDDWTEWLDIAAAIAPQPLVVVAGAMLLTARNGGHVAALTGRSRVRQFADQIGLAVTRGILPPWYYVFEFYRARTRSRLPDFLGRAETKEGVYRLLAKRRGASSPLADKLAFSRRCAESALPTPPVLALARDGAIEGRVPDLPEYDLFMKPIRASGGKGAERWNWTADGRYCGHAEQAGDARTVLDRLARRSCSRAMMVQPRIVNDASLADLANGALATVRVLTCLDERTGRRSWARCCGWRSATTTRLTTFMPAGSRPESDPLVASSVPPPTSAWTCSWGGSRAIR